MIRTGAVRSVDDMVRMTGQELDELYRKSSADSVPEGYAWGRAIFYPGGIWAVPLSMISSAFWQGKFFLPAQSMIVNKWFGVRIFKAKAEIGESWVDGKSSIVIDYRGMSRIFAGMRDEIRPVAPGLLLGLVHLRTAPPKLIMYIALDIRQPNW